ncbi:EAL domain-containing protein [Asticcacaulis sp. MM231]|uniref:EAL domain-containing protein n=1 Tax=Asticcacaulis sp. MM231 TaxID=3157666 RepID=UPI0032D5A6F5
MAFALAAADLLVEVGQDGAIVAITGAVKSLIGTGEESLTGRPIESLFVESESALIRQLQAKALETGRIEPAVMHVACPQGDTIAVTLGLCTLPRHANAYLTLSALSPAVAAKLPKRDDLTGLIAMSEFQHMAEKGISPNDPGSGAAMLREMRLVKIGGLNKGLKSLGETRAKDLLAEIGAILNASAADTSAARLGDESFGLIGRAYTSTQADMSVDEGVRLAESLAEAMMTAGLSARAARPQVTSVSLTCDGLQEKEIARALSYIFDNLSKADFVAPQSLKSAFEAAEREVVGQMASLRDIIDHERFDLHFQPVIELKSGQIAHHEALVRFGKHNRPFETIRFAENIGLIADLDMAVCKKVTALLADHPHLHLAVNISGFSVQYPEFCGQLNAHLHAHAALAERLVFEVTESHQIENMELASQFLSGLRRRGFKVCLDDFGAGASAYNYLRRLDVDYVKIDGAFLQRASADRRERALLRSVSVLCAELGCQTIGEKIETPEIKSLALDLGLTFGQGYLFGKPTAEVPQIKLPAANGRRVGQIAAWR